MSLDGVKWALRQSTGDGKAKAILVALGAYANGKGLAWPSTVKLAGELEINRKAVDGGLIRLQKGGFIDDSGDRKGDTGRVKVWRLRMAEATFPIAPPSGAIIDASIAPPSGAITNRPNCPVSATQLPLQAGQESLESSEANASAGEARDPVKELFDRGVELLTGTGVDEGRARSLIGHWRKSRSDGEVLTALIECRAKAISNPVEWLTKRLAVARYVSASGHEYRGTPEQVQREAERRHDMGTYWKIEGEKRREREARQEGNRP